MSFHLLLVLFVAGVAAADALGCPTENHVLIDGSCYRRTAIAPQSAALALCNGDGEMLVEGKDLEEMAKIINATDTANVFRGEFAWTTAERLFGFLDEDDLLNVSVNRNKGQGCIAVVLTKEGTGDYRAKSCDSSLSAICKSAPVVEAPAACTNNAGAITYDSQQSIKPQADAWTNLVVHADKATTKYNTTNTICNYRYFSINTEWPDESPYFEIDNGCDRNNFEAFEGPPGTRLILPALSAGQYYAVAYRTDSLKVMINNVATTLPSVPKKNFVFCILPDGSLVTNDEDDDDYSWATFTQKCFARTQALNLC